MRDTAEEHEYYAENIIKAFLPKGVKYEEIKRISFPELQRGGEEDNQRGV
jgi:hypothetical protein